MSSLRSAVSGRRAVAVAVCFALVATVIFASALSGWAWVTQASIERVSVDDVGTQSDGNSNSTMVCASGRYVAFHSAATNLVAGDTNGRQDAFVRDLLTDTTTRVSVDSSGVQGNRISALPSLSADGSLVAFQSASTNLVAGDTNASTDIFVRDIDAGTTVRVSVDSLGVQANSDSTTPTISADGRYVVFASEATDLVAGDTNGVLDLFVHDMVTGSTVRANITSTGTQADGPVTLSAISGDGSRVIFETTASNMTADDTNGAISDVFVRDLVAGTITLVSVSSGGVVGNNDSIRPYISADGTMVSYESVANNLVPGDTNNRGDVFVRDLGSGVTQRISVATDGTQGNAASGNGVISGDGNWVAFRSASSTFDPTDTNGNADIYIRDLVLGDTTRVSLAYDGAEADDNCFNPWVDADGSVVGFQSVSSNLVANDTNGFTDIFVVGVEKDTTPPVTTDDAPSVWQNIASIDVALSATDDLSGVAGTTYTVDAGAAQAYSGAISVTDEGDTAIEYASTDNAGNVETSSTAHVLIDRTVPTTSDDVPAGWQSSDVTVTLSGTDAISDVDHIMYGVPGGMMIGYAGPFQVTDEGETVFEYFAVDLAGNQDDTQTVSVFIDKTPPVTTSDAKSRYTASATISISATDAVSGVAATWASLDGGPYAPYVAPIKTSALGDHTLYFYSVDEAGNTEVVQTVSFEVTEAGLLARTGADALVLLFAAALAATAGLGLRKLARQRA